MPDGTNLTKISAIIHLPKELAYPLAKFYEVVQCVLQQYDQSLELIILDQHLDANVENEISRMNTEGNSVIFIREQFSTIGAWLNASRARAEGDYLLYIDNSSIAVNLKRAASSTLLLTAERNPDAGMIYMDYEIIQKTFRDAFDQIKMYNKLD